MLTGAPAGPLSCEQLGATRVPALVLSGELSRDGYRFGNEALLKCLPAGTPHVAIANAHHKWNEENPVAAAQAILAFISKH
jgi:pimeloyl-ACP methyl ester carboxylesterase